MTAFFGAIQAFFSAIGLAIQAWFVSQAKSAGRTEAERDSLIEEGKSLEQRKNVEDEISRMDPADIERRLREKWTRNS